MLIIFLGRPKSTLSWQSRFQQQPNATVAPMPAPTKQLNLLCVDADGATQTFRLPVALATGEEVSGRILLILAVVDHAIGDSRLEPKKRVLLDPVIDYSNW